MLCYNKFIFHDNKEIQNQYETQISRVFDAILLNPGIKKLSTFGSFGTSSEALYNLLCKTKTLKSFSWETFSWDSGYMDNTRDMSFAVARGLARNLSLQNVHLDAREIWDMDRAMAGIGFTSTIESLKLCQSEGSKVFYAAIFKVLHLTPSLKTLEVENDEIDEVDDDDFYDGDEVDPDAEAPMDQIFWDLARQPVCAGLEKLVLDSVRIGQGIVTLSNIPPIENCNHTLQVLDLSHIHFSNWTSVRLLWNLVGLRKLSVYCPVFTDDMDFQFDDDSDDEDEQGQSVYWKEFIRRNKSIVEVNIVDPHSWDNCAKGIVLGAFKHESLKTLRFTWGDDLDESVVTELGRLLCGNETLQTLSLSPVDIEPEGAKELAEGLYQNTSLQSFGFSDCIIHTNP